jgi:hypothetical protein
LNSREIGVASQEISEMAAVLMKSVISENLNTEIQINLKRLKPARSKQILSRIQTEQSVGTILILNEILLQMVKVSLDSLQRRSWQKNGQG